MDNKVARDNAYREFSQQSASLPGDKYAFKKGFDAGYKSACGEWVRIETDGLPTDTNVYLVSVDWYNDSRSTDFASYRDRHWWSERSDGYGEPIKLCDYGRVIAWREMPEPIADNEGGENA